MTLPAEKTLLILHPIGIPLYSARGLKQTLTPVPESKPAPRRTVNGEATFLGLPQMQKYNSSITCTDQNAPALGGVWPGDEILVNCVQELNYKATGGSPERTVVPDSSRIVGDYIFYRPQMTFLVVDHLLDTDEYGHDCNWQLILTEK